MMTDITYTLISEKHTALLIVDCQEKLMPGIDNNQNIIFEIKKLIDACKTLNIKTYHTEQNPEKLGSTIEEIRVNLDNDSYSKMAFSANECNDLKEDFNNNNIESIILCGIETHICILQTALDFISEGYNIIIPRDAIGSRKDIDNETGFLRLCNSGAIPATTESTIFELCKTAKRKEFKEITKIIKRSI